MVSCELTCVDIGMLYVLATYRKLEIFFSCIVENVSLLNFDFILKLLIAHGLTCEFFFTYTSDSVVL